MNSSSPPVRRAVLVSGLLLLIVAAGAFAQTQTGNIFGTVQTRDGAVLPGSTVTLTGVGAPQTFITDGQGRFRFLNLSPGTYQLRAELSGMGTATRGGVHVSIGQNADLTINL
ncbi:MAG TPA: carboxypeptidase-like regulatory domain-containing protein, partial [Thermoanaerobaculia bacterium]|nr:carboxypeptidase-like regulatory domain-containing protein [Thermoanaerobaculia bacterium]